MPELMENRGLDYFRKSALFVLVVFFCLGLLSNVYIHLSYAARMPRSPQPTTGRTFAINVNHGTLVYVNRDELKEARFVFGFGTYVTIVAGAALISISASRKKRPS